MTGKEKLIKMVGNENATKWVSIVQGMIESENVISMDDNEIATPVLTEVQ